MKQMLTSFLIFTLFSVITGLLYPLAITGMGQVIFPSQANGSLIKVNDKIAGSELIGQNFVSPKYFHSRPSALAIPYNGADSGGSNLSPTNKKLYNQINSNMENICKENGVSRDEKIPADLILTSASGLDPHISVDSAMFQVKRIASIRGLDEIKVKELIKKNTISLIFGEKVVNVLKLNIALDNL